MQPPINRDSRPTFRVLCSIVVVLVAHALMPRWAAAQPYPVLACGQIATGTIAAAAQQDVFIFAGEAGDVVTLTLVETSKLDVAFTAVVTLLGPGTNTTRTTGVSFHTLPASGTYGILVHDVARLRRGSYMVRLGWMLPSGKQCGDRTFLACGQEVQGSVGAELELDVFTFAAPQGAVMTLTLQELAETDIGFQVHGELRGPDGADLGFLAVNSTKTVNLPATGIYSLAIYDLGNYRRRGTYSLRLGSQGPCPPPLVPPSLNVGLNGTVFTPGTTLSLTGILNAGTLPGLVDAYIYVTLPTGAVLSLQLGGQLVPGLVPIARRLTPVNFQGVLVQYTFSGGEPKGTYVWTAMLTSPGTLSAVSPPQQLAFSVP